MISFSMDLRYETQDYFVIIQMKNRLRYCQEWDHIQFTILKLVNGLECIRIRRHSFHQCMHQPQCRIPTITLRWDRIIVVAIVADIRVREVDVGSEVV